MRSFTRPQLVLASAAGVALLGASGFGLRHHFATHVETQIATSVPAPLPATAVANAPAPAPTFPVSSATDRSAGCSFPDGAALSYAIRGAVHVKMDSSMTPAVAPAAPATLPDVQTASATLEVKALGTEAGKGATLLAKLHDVDANLTASRGDLSAPFLLRVNAQCKITEFARLATTSIRDGRGEQGLAYSLQWTWPTHGNEPQVDTGANDYGMYRATYAEVRGPSQALLVDRTLDAYTRVWSQDLMAGDSDAKRPEQKPIASRMTVDVGAGPWFAGATSSEHLTIVGTDVQTDVEIHSTAPMAHLFDGVPTDPKMYIWEDLLPKHVRAPAPAGNAEGVADHRTPMEKRAIAEAAKLTLPQAMQTFQASVKAKKTVSDVWPPLAHYLEAHPESAKVVAQEIKSGEIPQNTDAAVFIALGQTPNVEARDALLSLKNDPALPAFDRARSVFALVDRNDVGVELAHQLRSDAQDVNTGTSRETRLYARHAALALGMMASLHGSEEPEITEQARGVVTDLLSQGKTWVSLKPAFGTAANIGDSSLLGRFTPYMQSTDVNIRRESIIVIRRMAPSATTSLVVSFLQKETDADVKREIYRVTWLQHHDAQVVADRSLVMQAIADLSTRPGALTRQSIIPLLGNAKDAVPEAHMALLASVPAEYAARSEGVYDLLAQYLTATEMTAALGSQK